MAGASLGFEGCTACRQPGTGFQPDARSRCSGALGMASSWELAAAKPFPSPWCQISLSQERWLWGGHGSTPGCSGSGRYSCISPEMGWGQGAAVARWSGISPHSPSLSGWVRTVTHGRKTNYLLVSLQKCLFLPARIPPHQDFSSPPSTSRVKVVVFCSGLGETAPPEDHRSSHLLAYLPASQSLCSSKVFPEKAHAGVAGRRRGWEPARLGGWSGMGKPLHPRGWVTHHERQAWGAMKGPEGCLDFTGGLGRATWEMAKVHRKPRGALGTSRAAWPWKGTAPRCPYQWCCIRRRLPRGQCGKYQIWVQV